MSQAQHNRPCPMCGGLETEPHVVIDRGAGEFEIVRCAECQFVFVANPGAQTFHPIQEAPATVPEKARHRQIKRVCDRVLGSRARHDGAFCVIEVGAGWGGLARIFSRDKRYQYVGFEPSATRAAYCRARGFDVREGFFDDSETRGKVDAVVFDNVLEHVMDPMTLVRVAVACLREGGVLIVIVPNLNDIRRYHRRWRERHHWQPHCHINYFSSLDLNRLFSRHGMKARYFGLEVVGRTLDDIDLLPRVLADMGGWHCFGLNCYGVKPGSA